MTKIENYVIIHWIWFRRGLQLLGLGFTAYGTLSGHWVPIILLGVFSAIMVLGYAISLYRGRQYQRAKATMFLGIAFVFGTSTVFFLMRIMKSYLAFSHSVPQLIDTGMVAISLPTYFLLIIIAAKSFGAMRKQMKQSRVHQ